MAEPGPGTAAAAAGSVAVLVADTVAVASAPWAAILPGWAQPVAGTAGALFWPVAVAVQGAGYSVALGQTLIVAQMCRPADQ